MLEYSKPVQRWYWLKHSDWVNSSRSKETLALCAMLEYWTCRTIVIMCSLAYAFFWYVFGFELTVWHMLGAIGGSGIAKRVWANETFRYAHRDFLKKAAAYSQAQKQQAQDFFKDVRRDPRGN